MMSYHASPVEQVQVQVVVPHRDTPPLLRCKDFAQYNLLALNSRDQSEAILSACKPLAHELIAHHRPDLETSEFMRGIRWAATTQLLQAVLTGEQEPCLCEFDEANSHVIGTDVGFLQRALDEEISEVVDAGLCPHDEEGISRAAIRVLAVVLGTATTH
jgi:hypothetical protein